MKAPLSAPPADITTTSFSTTMRHAASVGMLILGSLAGTGCAVGPQRATVVPFTPPPTTPVAPVDPTFREAHKAFSLAHQMGLNHCAYVDSKGGRHSSLHGMRELSLSNAPQTKPGFVDNLDATFVHDGTPKSFKMGAFTEWQEKQAQGLLARPDLQRMLTIPGSGLLYSLEGEAFLVTPLGEGVHMAKIGPVQPFFEGETPR